MLRIGKTYYTFDGNNTDESPIIAFINMPMLCLNAECENYAGEDQSKPKYIVETVKNQVN